MPLRVIEEPPSEFKVNTDINMVVACDHDTSETLTDVYTYATLRLTDVSGHICDVVRDGPTVRNGEADDGLIVYDFKRIVITVPGSYNMSVNVFSRETEDANWVGTVVKWITVLNNED